MTPEEKDNRIQQAVLMFTLSSEPAQLSDDEVVRALTTDPDDFTERDAVLRALRDLNADGLLHHRDGFTHVTRAGLRAAALFEI